MFDDTIRANITFGEPDISDDEATSALDNETETVIMETVNFFQGKKTMVIIVHLSTTIENCGV